MTSGANIAGLVLTGRDVAGDQPKQVADSRPLPHARKRDRKGRGHRKYATIPRPRGEGAGLPFCRVTLKASWQPASYPKELRHLGDHVRKRRLDLGLTQAEAARRIGVDKQAIKLWELGRFEPTVSCLPAVIEFLGGVDPRPEPTTWPEWLVWYRAGRGLSQQAMARELGVAARTLWSWETGKSTPMDENLAKLSVLQGSIWPRGRIGHTD